MEQLFSLPATSGAQSRTARTDRSGADRDRFDAAFRDAVGEPRSRERAEVARDRSDAYDRAADRADRAAERARDRAAERVDRAADRAADRARDRADLAAERARDRAEPAVERATDRRDPAGARGDAGDASRRVEGTRGGSDRAASGPAADGSAASDQGRPAAWAFGQLARDIMAQLDAGNAPAVGADAEAAAAGTDEAEAMLADLAEAADTLTGTVGELAEDLETALEELVASVDGEGEGAVLDGAEATELAEEAAALLAQLAAEAEAGAQATSGDAPAAGDVTAEGATEATGAAGDAAATTDDQAAAEAVATDAAAGARERGPAENASPRAAERASATGQGEPVRASENGPPRSPRAEERAADPRVTTTPTTTRTDSTGADEVRPASSMVDGLRSAEAPRADAARQTTMPSSVQRVLDLVSQLEKMPPPRQLVLELGDLRVRVGMEDGQVRLTVLAGNQRDANGLLADARDALAQQGFDLAQDGFGDGDGEDDTDTYPGERTGTARSDGLPETGAERSRADARTAGLRL